MNRCLDFGNYMHAASNLCSTQFFLPDVLHTRVGKWTFLRRINIENTTAVGSDTTDTTDTAAPVDRTRSCNAVNGVQYIDYIIPLGPHPSSPSIKYSSTDKN